MSCMYKGLKEHLSPPVVVEANTLLYINLMSSSKLGLTVHENGMCVFENTAHFYF